MPHPLHNRLCVWRKPTVGKYRIQILQTSICSELHITCTFDITFVVRTVANQGFGAARRMLAYKTTWNGGTLTVADRWFPSSKTCDACGMTLDRDVNAARNLLHLAASGAESQNGCGGTTRPGTADRSRRDDHPISRESQGAWGIRMV